MMHIVAVTELTCPSWMSENAKITSNWCSSTGSSQICDIVQLSAKLPLILGVPKMCKIVCCTTTNFAARSSS